MKSNEEIDKKNTAVIFLSEGGYKLSSWYGKILANGATYPSLDAAKNACATFGLKYKVA